MPGQKAKLSGMAVLIGNLMALQPVRGLFAGAAFLVLYELHLLFLQLSQRAGFAMARLFPNYSGSASRISLVYDDFKSLFWISIIRISFDIFVPLIYGFATIFYLKTETEIPMFLSMFLSMLFSFHVMPQT